MVGKTSQFSFSQCNMKYVHLYMIRIEGYDITIINSSKLYSVSVMYPLTLERRNIFSQYLYINLLR